MAIDSDLKEAHRHSSNHRAEMVSSPSCGCFCCLAVFSPSEVLEWVDKDFDGVGTTALCPRCGVDSVIGSNAGVSLDRAFLSKMHEYWFER